MPTIVTIADRYQISGEPVDKGGMGVVYKAYDTVLQSHVAVKTIRGPIGPAALELFNRERSVLSGISHPNIVDILDTGEFEEGGQKKPFYVMPFLSGNTLDYLIRHASQRLTVERVVEIIQQVCRGLQWAHEKGVIHRDLKPSNIFVMEDNAAKIIDFGVVHLAGTQSIAGLKGTLPYMAPEQIDMRAASPATDIFALAAVCYEALTGRKPFDGLTETAIAEAVRHHVPPPACELNPLVNELLSRVVHKAMAKAAVHRFASAREFGETLQKALNNQPIEPFDKSKIQPRIQRARRAVAEGEPRFASELLGELEAEGHFDPEMTLLRVQINQAMRQRSIRQLLDSVRACREAGELPLALQKIQDVLNIDPENAEAIALRRDIEKELSDAQVEDWFRLVEQHLHNHAFAQARQALEEIVKVAPANSRARDALLDIDRREKEIIRLRAEKEQWYQAAVESYEKGERSAALSKMERVVEVIRTTPDSAIPDRDAQYQRFFDQLRTERDEAKNAHAEARRCLREKKYERAIEICSDFLNRHPGDAMFQAAKLEAEEGRRQEYSAYIADVARRAEAEPDLDRRVNILKEAVDRCPDESTFQQSLRLTRDRRDLVNAIVTKARQYEDRAQFSDALSQWDTLRNIYPQYPGLEYEVERLERRRDEQARAEARARWVDEIDRALGTGDYARARDLVKSALAEFPDDGELGGLDRVCARSLERANEAAIWLQRGQQLCFDREFAQGLAALRKAAELDAANPVIRAALLNALVEQARSVLGQDWRAAEPLIEEAVLMDREHPNARSVQALVVEHKRRELVAEAATQVRELQAAGDVPGAIARVDEALASFPDEKRLIDLRSTLIKQAGSDKAVRQEPARPGHHVPEVKARHAAATAGDTGSYVAPAPFDSFGPSVVMPADQPHPLVPDVPVRKQVGKSRLKFPALRDWRFAIPRFSRLEWGAVAFVPLVAFVGMWATRPKNPPRQPAPHDFPVTIRSDAAGAAMTIDGRRVNAFPQRLATGPHTLVATAPGFRAVTKEFTVASNGSSGQMLDLHLEPEAVRLHVSSDLKSGKAAIDDQMPADLQDGNFADEQIGPQGDHKVTVLQSGKPAFVLSFHAQPGQPAAVTAPLEAKELSAIAISNLAGQSRIYAAGEGVKAGLAGQTLQPVPEGGLTFTGLKSDSELVAEYGGAVHPLPPQVSNAPSVNVLIWSDPTTATVRIMAGVADADLSVDGRKPRRMRSMSASLLLPPGKHTVRVSKDGYIDQTQTVELKKGGSVALPAFDLTPIPRLSSLVIEGATAGADVWVDDARVGITGADGSFSKDRISPQDHTITLRKTDFEDKEVLRTFTAGQAVHLAGNDSRLTPFGFLTFRIAPENAVVSYKRDQEKQDRTIANGSTIHVKAGRYTVSAAAPGRVANAQQITVAPGGTVTVQFALNAPEKRLETHPKLEPVPPDPAYWAFRDGWYQHNKKDFAPWPVHGGTVRVGIRRPKDTRIFGVPRLGHVTWVIETGPGQQVVYSLDRRSIERKTRPERQDAAAKHSVDLGPGDWNIEVEMLPDRIEIRSNGKVLDSYQRPNPNEPTGRFLFEGDVAAKPE